MIIDDDTLSRRIIEEFIQKTDGLDLISSSGDPVEGINILKKHDEIHLIFLDIEMPEMTGIELCEKIREMPQYRFTPVTMLTAMAEHRRMLSGEEPRPDEVAKIPLDALVRELAEVDLRARDVELRTVGHRRDVLHEQPAGALRPLRGGGEDDRARARLDEHRRMTVDAALGVDDDAPVRRAPLTGGPVPGFRQRAHDVPALRPLRVKVDGQFTFRHGLSPGARDGPRSPLDAYGSVDSVAAKALYSYSREGRGAKVFQSDVHAATTAGS